MNLQHLKQVLIDALALCKNMFQRLWEWLFPYFENVLEFWSMNPAYLICSIVYYIISCVILGGGFWIYLSILFIYVIALMVGFSEVGEEFLRLINHVRPIETRKEKEYLLPLFQEVYTQAKEKHPELDKIKICIIDSMTVNAMALGKHTIAVTKGAMATFSEEELKAVMTHEIAHIIHMDTMASLYAIVGNGIFTIIILFYRLILFLLDLIDYIFTRKKGFFRFLLTITRFVFEAMVFLLSFLMQIAISANSRTCEFRADEFAFQIGYDADMIDALYLLEKISLGDNSTIIQKMIASHPRVTLRINRLEQLDEQREEYVPLIP